MSKMQFHRDSIVFSTGKVKKVAANGIGIRMVDDDPDGRISICDAYGNPVWRHGEGLWPDRGLTPEECIELADAVIARWEQFKKQVSKD